MDDSVERIGILLVGVAIGALSTMTYFKRKYKAIADEEIESCKKIFERRKPQEKKEEKESTIETFTYAPRDTEESLEYKSYYNAYAPKEVTETETIFSPAPEEDEPFEIGAYEFTDDNEFDKVTLNFYTEDGVLIYEEGEEIADDNRTIGSENLDDFLRTYERSSYFRNPKTNIDYEVIKIEGSYKELIAGDI